MIYFTATQSSSWYAWGPVHMQCRLCSICWSYWKKYGGLKMPTRLGRLSGEDGSTDGTYRTRVWRNVTSCCDVLWPCDVMLRLVTWCLCYKVYILVWRHTGYNSSASNMLLWNERCDVTPCYYPKCNVPNAHTIDNNYTWFYIEVCTKKFDISFVVGKPSAYCFILVSNVSNCQIFYQKQLWMFATLFIWQLWLSLSCWCTAQCSFACRIFPHWFIK